MHLLQKYPALAKHWFKLDKGSLVRRLKNGQFRQVSHLVDGKLVTDLKGKRVCAAKVAWTCEYGLWPDFPITLLDKNPCNIEPSNLVPRAKVPKLALSSLNRGFKHNLSEGLFPTEELAAKDWQRVAAILAENEKLKLLKLQTERIARLREDNLYDFPVIYSLEKPLKAPRPYKPKTEKPPKEDGFEHYWLKDQWVKVPLACCIADDIKLRAEAVLNGFSKFALINGKVLPVS